VQGWKRNDVTGEWRERYLFKTSTAKNTRNPVWKGKGGRGEVFPLEILSGAFEARGEEEDEGIIETMKEAMKSSKTKRREREEEEVAALDRFGDSGLKVKFGAEAGIVKPDDTKSSDGRSNAGDSKAGDDGLVLGANHGVEVYLGDSIREFKAKVMQACDKEQKFWQKKGVSFDDKAKKYADVTVAYKHLVMIFVPTPKVQQLYAQGLYKGSEYKHAYNIALSDPSSWQPMEPTRTFNQYPQYHFDVKTPQQLRIVEATESYKLLNLRYKEFENDRGKKRFEDTDTETDAYGFAKYKHLADSSVEWRPSIVTNDEKKQGYNVDWCFKPFRGDAKPGEPAERPLPAGDVMLAPRVPLMEDNFDPAQLEFLEQAKTFRSMGKSDWDIEAQLNKQMNEKWMHSKKSSKQGESAPKPPKITVDIIRTYITRQDTLAQQKDSAEAEGKQEHLAIEGKASERQGK